MPDFGVLRKGLAARAKEAPQQVAAKAARAFGDHGGGAPSGDAEPADADDAASTAEVSEEAGRLRALLDRYRPDPGPVVGRWSLGVGDLLATHPRMPRNLGGLVRGLDRYGSLAITETTIEFDGDKVEWSSVTEIRTRNIIDYLMSDAVNQQLDTVPVPWFPGRRKVLDSLSKAMLTLLLATAKGQLDRKIETRIPAEVHYRGTLRRPRELAPGILAALVLADPAVNECMQETARAHGIVIRPADDDRVANAEQRAEQVRKKITALDARLRR